jgi:hypothetical protein
MTQQEERIKQLEMNLADLADLVCDMLWGQHTLHARATQISMKTDQQAVRERPDTKTLLVAQGRKFR